ncbi:SDR family oxidoreductase [Rhodocytophaga aerolata]|uniref:SDR family oxidoreductase n=1 Tax=Rhodocytophaga aerolata TaxID=455078 RepID=A0ABT8R138_9BACT|nr:SDR family oxidoreductase [Rhodocytophaga aerolata]MDO1445028.1 SDR family oxidoreductase [Rhodocytophaga aerolata]
MFQLTGKTAVITGGGSGIGKAIAKIFARQEAQVAIIELNKANGESTIQEITNAGGKASLYTCDVSKQSEVKQVFDQIYADLGKVNILVNSAGVSHIGNLEKTTEADFDRLFAVNVKGVYNCLLYGVEKMKLTGGGAIVNLASIAGIIGIPDRFAYSMSKGAVLSMTLSVARDYIDQNIRCNCISPGRVHTPFVDDFLKKNYPGQEQEMFQKLSKTQPIGRMGTPDEMAALVLYLCSDEAGFVTGSDYNIDGGFLRIK